MNARLLDVIVAATVFIAVAANPLPAGAQLLKIAPTSQARRDVVLVPVQLKTVTNRIVATAIVEPDAAAVAQVTSEIPARVVRPVAPLGKNVRPGEPLAILSSVELGQAKTDYLKTRSLEGITSQHLAREESLYTRKITPMKDLLEARAQHDTALAEYQAARERAAFTDPGEPNQQTPMVGQRAAIIGIPAHCAYRRHFDQARSVDWRDDRS